MTQKNETLALVIALVATAGIIGGGYVLLKSQCAAGQTWFFCGIEKSDTRRSPLPPPPSPQVVTTFDPPTNIPNGTTIRIDGSTSMVQINRALKNALSRQFSGVQILTNGRGSEEGIKDLLNGSIDIAAISRPLTEAEIGQGLVATPVVRDAIAIVIGVQNPLPAGLTEEQVKGIFTGRITSWSEVGGSPAKIRVINRPPVSGTYKTFQTEVLRGESFGNGPNFQNMERDATTPILQALGIDGIGYATYAQVARQKTVRTVNVDGISPGDPTYPFQRTLYYVYKEPANNGVKAFMGFVVSSEGQAAIFEANQALEK